MKIVSKILSFLLASVIVLSIYENTYRPQYKYKEYDTSMYTMDRSKLLIGIFDYEGALMTEEHLKTLKECGIDYIVHTGNSDAFFELCEKYNVGIIAKNLNAPRYVAENTPREQVQGIEHYANLGERYKDFGTLYGDDIFDEPNSVYFDLFNDIVKVYREQKPDKFPYFNLHPMYCPDYQYYLGTTTYEEYIRLYAEKVDTDYICFDIYPFDNAESGLYSRFLDNMDVVATACRDSGRDFWVITQAGANNSLFALRKPQVGWQLYTSLAYGAVSLIHACYTPCWWAGDTSIVTRTGEKNPLYEIVQEYNAEIHALSDVFMQYKNLGVVTLGTPSNYKLKTQFETQEKRNAERHFSINTLKKFINIKSDKGAIVGCFKEKDGNGYAAMFVNSIDPYFSGEVCTITFRAALGAKVTAYIKGQKVDLKPVRGVYTLKIDSGDGVFVTVD